MKKIISSLLLAAFLVVLPTSCKKDKEGAPPGLPPASTMKIDFADFVAKKKSADDVFTKGTENSNWEFAALVSGYWNLMLFTTLIVPVRAYEIAVDQTPVSLGNNTWQWEYNASVATVSYHARLTGQIRSTDVLWEMYISKTGTDAFDEFMWFTGTSKLDGTGGRWTLNFNHVYQVPFIQIDWEGTAFTPNKIRYTYVRTTLAAGGSDPWNGSYIEYGFLTSGSYNAYYTINYYDGAASSDVFIQWSTTDHSGQVKCESFFGDTDWHAWNSNLVNI